MTEVDDLFADDGEPAPGPREETDDERYNRFSDEPLDLDRYYELLVPEDLSVDVDNPGYRHCHVGIKQKTDQAVLLWSGVQTDWFPLKSILDEDRHLVDACNPDPGWNWNTAWDGVLRINGFFLKQKGWIK